MIASLALFLPLSMFAARWLGGPAAKVISFAAFIWMGMAFLLFSVVVLTDLLRVMLGLGGALLAFARGAQEASELGGERVELARREVLARAVASTATVSAAALTAVSVRAGLGEVEVAEVNVKLEKLPKALDGLTLVQLTDVHVGPTIGRKFIEAIVEKTNRARPDAVVITGDLVDGSPEELLEHLRPLSKLSARHGLYFVTGNHEYYSGAVRWVEVLGKLGIRVLRNERVWIGDTARLALAGVDDASAARMGVGHGADLSKALAGCSEDAEVVLLAHQPKAVIEASTRDVGLVLSGHTHGGQIFPWGAFVGLTQPYVAGLHAHGERTQIYVSKGTGYWGPPMRLLAPSEITKIVLST